VEVVGVAEEVAQAAELVHGQRWMGTEQPHQCPAQYPAIHTSHSSNIFLSNIFTIIVNESKILVTGTGYPSVRNYYTL
jgi:hypothetical protein